jgi:hypothetical protein
MEPEQRIEQKPEKPWFLEAGFIVPLVAFIAYFSTVSYELQFCNYFGILYYVISINISIVLTVNRLPIVLCTFIPILVLAAVHISNIIAPIALKTPIRSFFVTIILLFLFLLFSLYNPIWIEDRTLWILPSIANVILLIFIFVKPLFTRKQKGSYKDKLISHFKYSEEKKCVKSFPYLAI